MDRVGEIISRVERRRRWSAEQATKAEAEAKAEAAVPATPNATDTTAGEPALAKSKKPRRKFSERLPRTTVVHKPQACPTPGCDGTLSRW